MKLTLLRHAKSSWNDESLSDFDRPLNRRGIRDAPDMAQRLKDANCRAQRLLCSPALRTRQTSDHFAATLDIKAEERILVPEIYEASAGTLIEVIAQHGQTADELLLIGHNPGIEYLSAMLNGGERLAVATCTVCRFDISGIDDWRMLANAGSRLLFYDFPKKQSNAGNSADA